MSSPFQVELDLYAPTTQGEPPVSVPPLPLVLEGTYTPKQQTDLKFSGAGTKTVDLGSLGPSGEDIKLLLIYQRRKTGAQPITVTFNSAAAGALTIGSGGFLLWANDTAQSCPTVGIETTAAAEVVVVGLG
jgi:hypothetical protein